MRVLITGIDGFVGTHLAAHLRDAGDDVFGTTIGPEHDQVFHADLNTATDLDRVVAASQPGFVFHLAGFTSVKLSWDQAAEAMRVNRDGTRELYSVLRRARRTPRLLITGTAEVYGQPKHTPITEQHPTNPTNPYAESKLAQEAVAQDFPEIPTVITRSFPHIGPGQSPTFVTSDFARQIVAIERGGEPRLQVGNLDAVRDFTDVRDVVRAYSALLQRGTTGHIYNVCSGHGYRIADVLHQLVALSSRPNITITTDAARMRPSDIPELVGSPAALQSATGWHPTLPLEQTLRDILDYWRNQPV